MKTGVPGLLSGLLSGNLSGEQSGQPSGHAEMSPHYRKYKARVPGLMSGLLSGNLSGEQSGQQSGHVFFLQWVVEPPRLAAGLNLSFVIGACVPPFWEAIKRRWMESIKKHHGRLWNREHPVFN